MDSKWALSRDRWPFEGPDIIRRTQNIGIVSSGIVTIHRGSELNFSPTTNVGDGSWSCQNGLRDDSQGLTADSAQPVSWPCSGSISPLSGAAAHLLPISPPYGGLKPSVSWLNPAPNEIAVYASQ
jgi:hypothetical protein